MSYKVYARHGGAVAATQDDITARVPALAGPGNQPIIQMGMSFQNGGASQGTFITPDPVGNMDDSLYFPPRTQITWIEDASGDELWLARGRVSAYEIGRPDFKPPASNVQWNLTVDDANVDLRGLAFTEDWVRPAETGTARLYALALYTLNGTSSTRPDYGGSITYRPSTTIIAAADHKAPDTNTTVMPAKTYPIDTQPNDVLTDIASTEGKVFGVVIHHTGGTSHLCLEYILETDHSTYASPCKISDVLADWDPEDLTAPVFEPIYDQGFAQRVDGNAFISGLVTRWGAGADQFYAYLDTTAADATEYWVESYQDGDSSSAAQSAARTAAIIAYRAPYAETDSVSIVALAEQTHLLTAGMSIQVKAAPINTSNDSSIGTYLDRRIVSLQWEPMPDGRYHGILQLNKGIRGVGGGASQPASTTPRPAPECLPADPGGIGDPVAGAALLCTVGTADPNCGSMAGDSSCSRSGVHTANSGSTTVTPGSYYSEIQLGQKYGTPSTCRFWVAISDSSMTLAGFDVTIDTQVTTACTDWVTLGGTFDVPAGYDTVVFHTKGTGGIMHTLEGSHTFSEYTAPGPAPDNDPYCMDDPGSSPYYARSDDPRFTAANQHETNRLTRTMINGSGSELTSGAVVIAVDNDTFDTTSSAALTTARIGVLLDTTPDGEQGVVAWEFEGFIPPTLTATTTAGYFIYTSTTPGEATTSATRTTGAIGRVVTVDADDIPSFVEWWGVPDGGGGGADDIPGEMHGLFVSAYHRAADNYPVLMTSPDGITWADVGVIRVENRRDPSMIHWDGSWWMVATGGASSFQVYKATDPTDLPWGAAIVTVTVDGSGTDTWAPEWIRNMDGTPYLHPSTGFPAVTVNESINSGSNFTVREIHPTNRGMTTWSSSTTITGTSLPSKMIDAFLLVDGDDYWLWYKNDTPHQIELAHSSTALTSGYTILESGDWAGWFAAKDAGANSTEGPCVIRLDDGRWRIYFNENNGFNSIRTVYSDSLDDWATWTTQAVITTDALMGHGSVIYLPGMYDHERDPLAHELLLSGFMLEGEAAGGDLSGTYPNPSVVDDSHNHTSTTAPGGGIGEILISDTPSTPLIFADLIQNEAQTDLVYADP